MRRAPSSFAPTHLAGVGLVLALALLASPAFASENFESPPVHPIELSPDSTRLFAVHTADQRLVVYDLTGPEGPERVEEIPVGLEPITVRARSNNEVWVINHISDSISIIDLTQGHVVRTLLVGDEPTDVVFAGTPERAFVCLSQEDKVRVYNPADFGEVPVDIPLDASDPRSLAVSPDGSLVYVCALESGNRTTVVPFETVWMEGGLPPPNPPMNEWLPEAPNTALIVRHDGLDWLDEINRSWNTYLPYTLFDQDVIEISTSTLTVTRSWSGVGTSLFNLAINPTSGRIYVSNQEADNHIRFEPNLKGKFLQNRVTTIDPGSSVVTARHLNAHIDYDNPAGSAPERALSLSLPLDLAVSNDGLQVYVVAFGSHKVGVLDADGVITRRIEVGQGPAGLALDEPRNRLYVWNRFTSSISVVNLFDDSSTEVSLGYDPSPTTVTDGRSVFYDGANSSAHGDLSCASCHLFGTMDGLVWDLGDPTGEFVDPPPGDGLEGFHPMKGPMVTQTLRGLPGTEPFHWRGDRDALAAFNPAFVSLLGRESELPSGDFQKFEDFVFTLRYPGNPNRNLDDTLPDPDTEPSPNDGALLFLTGNLVGDQDCVDCHANPTGENGLIIPGAQILSDQDMKVAQLRNMYEKTRFNNEAVQTVRGFGYTHDGAKDDLFSFLQFPGFDFVDDDQRLDMAAYLVAFETGTHAAVGAQLTLDGTNGAEFSTRIQTLVNVAGQNRIGLIAKGRDGSGQARGWVYLGGGVWHSDRASEGNTNLGALLALADPGTEVTLTAVIEGTEIRRGIDRDGDLFRDRDELDAGSDPGNPAETPANVGLADIPGLPRIILDPAEPNPAFAESRLEFLLEQSGPARLAVYDVEGRRVRVLLNESAHPAGRFESLWDLRDDRGHQVSGGVYFVRLDSGAASGSQRVVIRR